VQVSRRAWLVVAAGTLAAGAAGVLWRFGGRDAASSSPASGAPAGYVDHEGWMLTPADEQRLAKASQAAVQSP
jgi:hypothetical protein